jgi:type VI secretion system protein ImpM
MPRAHLITGFYGKIPAAGDFVGRALPADFIRFCDRWVASNLVMRETGESWDGHLALCFLAGEKAAGPMAGVVMPSRDRAGRRFPLTLAASLPLAAADLVVAAEAWFSALQQIGRSACDGDLDAGQLAERLSELPFPVLEAEGESIDRLALWTQPDEVFAVDPDAASAVLDHLLTRPEVNV